jgi:glutathione peroxidase
MKTLHDFTVTTIDGKELSLSVFNGKKVLVVNTASKCGFTPQYEELEKLYKEFGDEKFSILGFPANNFLWQEPGSNEQIAQFCTLKYGVSFPMFARISVKGKKIHPLYAWLTRKEENGVQDAKVKWNFQKFMIDEQGRWAGVVPPADSPYCNTIISWLKNG